MYRSRSEIDRDEVERKAKEAWRILEGLNKWDRRRVLQRIERFNKYN